jgi:hypothetical protein
MPNIPIDTALYSKIKSEAKNRFAVWPSAYASGWLVKEYKRRGGKYKISSGRKSSSSPRKRTNSGLTRWFAEKWVDVCQLPRIVPCGRKSARRKMSGSDRTGSQRRYPYCRPLYKINSKSPLIAGSLSVNEIRKRCKSKRKQPYKRVYG